MAANTDGITGLEFAPLTPDIGIEAKNIDISAPLDKATATALRRAGG